MGDDAWLISSVASVPNNEPPHCEHSDLHHFVKHHPIVPSVFLTSLHVMRRPGFSSPCWKQPNTRGGAGQGTRLNWHSSCWYPSLVPRPHFTCLPERLGLVNCLFHFYSCVLECWHIALSLLKCLTLSKIVFHIVCQWSTGEKDIDWATLAAV